MSQRNNGFGRGLAILAAGALALEGAALAADEGNQDRDSAYLTALKACQAEAAEASRLACYDKTVASILAASEKGELRVVDREQVRQARRKLFGFSLPDFGIFGGRDDDRPGEEKVDKLETTISKVRPSDNAGWIIVTAEGAVWRVDNVPSRLLSPKVGQTLEIRSGALSSYFLRINGQPGVKGYRVG